MPARKRAKRSEKKSAVAVKEQSVAETIQPQVQQAPVTPVVAEGVPDASAPQPAANPPVVDENAAEAPASQALELPSDEPLVTQDEEIEGEGSSMKKFLLWFVMFILLFVIVFGVAYFSYQMGVKKGEEKVKQENAAKTPAISVAPTEAPEEVDKSAYSITVLNGSGISGEAAKAQLLLEDGAFEVLDIGNANESNVEKTIIAAKNDVDKDYLKALKETLSKSYKLGEDETLEDDEDDDVVVTIGKAKVEQ